MPFHQQQFEFMLKWACVRPEWLKPFFLLLRYLDSYAFFFVLVPYLIWRGYKKWAVRVAYWSILNSIINSLAKAYFEWPRPTHDDAAIGLVQHNSFGFPSGGAETAMFLGALFIYATKSWKLGVGYIFVASFARIALGVHYPIDILGGWAIGFTLFLAYLYLNPRIERFFSKRSRAECALWSILVPCCFLFFKIKDIHTLAALAILLGIWHNLLSKK